MKTFLLSLVSTLAVAASLVVLIDRFQGPRTPSAELVQKIEQRLAALEKALAATATSAAPAGGVQNPEARPPKQRTLADIYQLCGEIEGMILDAEKTLRRDLTGVYEKLLARLEEVSTRSGAPGNPAEAKAALRQKLDDMGVKVIEDQGMVEVQGEFSESTRVIELVAVAPGGRVFESLLLLQLTPVALKLALEDLGLVESEPDTETWTFAENASSAYLYLLWDGLKKPRRVEDVILNLKTNDTMTRTKWMFTASYFFTDTRTWDRHFAADFNKSVIALCYKYTSEGVLACPLEDAADENIWMPHPDHCPKPGTKVRLFIRKEPNPEWDKI